MGHEAPYEGIRSPSEAQQKRIARREIDQRGPGRSSLAPTILAGAFMASVGGYFLTKHFPSARLHVLGQKLATALENPRRLGIPDRLADAITKHLGSMSSRVAGVMEQASARGHIADIVDSSSFTAPEVSNALRLLYDTLAVHPESFSTVDDIIRAVGSKYKSTPQKSLLSLRRLKVGDLYDEAGQWKAALGREPQKLGDTTGLIKGLYEKLPALKSTIADLPIDSGLFFYQDKVMDLRQWTPTSWMSSLDKAADAGGVGARLGRWALGLMAPTGLLTPRGGIAVVGGSSVRPHMEGASKFAQQHLQGGLFMQGKLFPVLRGGSIGDVVHESALLVRKRSQIGGMIGKTAARPQAIDKWIEGHAESFAKLGRFEGAAKTAATWADKIGVRPKVQPDMGEPILKSMYRFAQDPKGVAQEGAWKAYKFVKGTRPKPINEYATVFNQSSLAATGKLKAADHFFNYQLSRVGYLLESTVGLGIQPGKSTAGTMARWLAVGGATWAGVKYAGYANHLVRDAVGIGPIDLPIHGYMAARQGLQGTIELLGARKAANYLEDTFPGSIKSPGSRIMQGIGAAQLAKKFGAPGAVVAGVAALATGTDLTMSSAKLGRIYRGEEDVEVRKSRYWALGSSPYFGGDVEYRRPHLLALALTDYKKEAIHGSAANYYKEGTYLPTPSNWFGARKLLFPYETELRNAYTRPYPVSGTAGESIPIIGPAFAATVGRLIKPRKTLHSDYFYKDTLLEPGKFTAMRGEFGTSGLTQQQRRPQAVSNLRLDQAVGKQIDVLRDFTGMPGFLLGAIKGKITGDADFFSGKRQIATSADMDSYERGYYDLRMGGLVGMTEGLRRMLPHRRRQIQTINPIINSMPDWIPGSMSAFKEDRSFHHDWHRGDPYTSIPHGEARLPGVGYEAIARLHSGVVGCYDAFDRYKILSSIAPYSEAFKHYEAIVQGQIRTSSLASESEGKHLEGLLGSDIRGIVARVVDGDTMEVSIDGKLTTVRMAGVNTPESSSTRRRENTAEGLLATQYTREQFEGQEVSLTPWGLDPHGRLLAKVDRSYQIAGKGPGEILREEYPAQSMLKQDRAEFNRIQDTVRDRFEPHKFHEKIFSNPFSVVARNQRKLQTMTMGKRNENVVAQGQYTLPEKLTGWAYENVAHFEPPGPIGWVKNKFFPIRSAEEHYKRFRVTGKAFAPWETPIESFAKPWMWSSVDAVTPGPTVVPSQVKKRWAVESHFDRLKYAKSKILSNQARSIGELSQAQYWARQSKKTATYALAAGNANFARSGLPRLDRPYYNAFVRTTEEAERDRIRNIVSPDMRGLLELSWSSVKPQKVDPDVEAAAYLSTAGYPKKDWAGWSSNVSLDLAKLQVARDEGIEYHEMGLRRDQEVQAEIVFDDWRPMEIPDLSMAAKIRSNMYRLLKQSGYSDIFVDITERPAYNTSASINFRHQRNPMYNILEHMGYSMNGFGSRF